MGKVTSWPHGTLRYFLIYLPEQKRKGGSYVESLAGLGFHAQQQVKYHITSRGLGAPWLRG